MFEKCWWPACLFFFSNEVYVEESNEKYYVHVSKKNHILVITEVSESRQQSSILVRTDHCSNYKLQHELETKISLNDTNLSIPTEYITWERFRSNEISRKNKSSLRVAVRKVYAWFRRTHRQVLCFHGEFVMFYAFKISNSSQYVIKNSWTVVFCSLH